MMKKESNKSKEKSAELHKTFFLLNQKSAELQKSIESLTKEKTLVDRQRDEVWNELTKDHKEDDVSVS